MWVMYVAMATTGQLVYNYNNYCGTIETTVGLVFTIATTVGPGCHNSNEYGTYM